jgi:flagellin-like protein
MLIGVKSMTFTKKNEDAVSPVIGVILMVAITVILAAVIAAFVFGMAGNIQQSHTVAATMDRPNGTAVIVTYSGGQDANTLYALSVTVDGLDDSTVWLNTSTTANTAVPVGVSRSVSADKPGQNHIVAVGSFMDGSQQVILDNTL